VRGLSTLHILQGLMRRVNKRRVELGKDEVKPCQIFDLIGGTSTGGYVIISARFPV
jgi:patatin-like phospholipase/acyl hydrolase